MGAKVANVKVLTFNRLVLHIYIHINVEYVVVQYIYDLWKKIFLCIYEIFYNLFDFSIWLF